MDMISEGIAMPLGAMLMSIMVGWEIKPKSLYGEIDSGYNGPSTASHLLHQVSLPRDHVLSSCLCRSARSSVWAGSTDRSIRSFSYNETKQPQPAAFWLPVFAALRRRSPCSPRPDSADADLCTALFRLGK